MKISDVPLAVLVGHNGYQRVWTLRSLPPPPDIHIARRAPMSLSVEDQATPHLPQHRRFVLSRTMRAPGLKWWLVYNKGRSRTPEDGYVYLESSR